MRVCGTPSVVLAIGALGSTLPLPTATRSTLSTFGAAALAVLFAATASGRVGLASVLAVDHPDGAAVWYGVDGS